MQRPNPATQQLFDRAVQHHQNGQLAEAEAIYRKINRKQPKFLPAYHHLANLLATTGKLEEAASITDRLVRVAPNNADFHFLNVGVLSQLGLIHKALEANEKMRARFPQLADVHFNQANLLLAENRQQEALDAINKMLELDATLASGHFNKGNILYTLNELGQAAESFNQARKLDPDMASAYVNEGHVLVTLQQIEEANEVLAAGLAKWPHNAMLLKNMGMAFHHKDQLPEAEQHYRKSLQQKADDPETLVLLGNVIRDQGQADKAKDFYQKALEIEPEHTLARQNLEDLNQAKIQSWHLEMLADRGRNAAYDQAIRKAVQPGNLVLDIGTGSSLLAMMAARAGAKQVVGCEMMDDLAQSARKVVEHNGWANTISILNKKSTALEIGTDLPEKADVLVSEILDCGLLGEGVLPTHRQAVNNLLKPNGRVVPQAAVIRGIILQSDYLAAVHPIHTIEGFDLSPLGQYDRNSPYHMYHLKRIPHVRLSDEFEATHINLAAPPPLATKDQPNTKELTVTITTEGRVDAVAFWFDLHLFEDVQASSGPDGEMLHWGQACSFFEEPIEVKAGDQIQLKLIQHEHAFSFELWQ